MQDNTWFIESDASLGELAYEGEAVVTVCIEWEAVDNGIGDYEYWGSKESHHDWQMEVADVTIEEAFLYTEEGNEIPVNLIDPANKPLIEYWSKYVAENAEYD
jgi:hypothetical protein